MKDLIPEDESRELMLGGGIGHQSLTQLYFWSHRKTSSGSLSDGLIGSISPLLCE